MAVYRTQPDPATVADWVTEHNDGMALVDIAAAFANTPEFAADYDGLDDQGFIVALYNNVYGRPADGPGFSWWLGELQARPIRSFILLQFCQTPEFASRTNTS